MEAVQTAMDWIAEQDRLGIYPEFGEDCQVFSMEALCNMPQVAGNDAEGIKYMFPVRITFFYLGTA